MTKKKSHTARKQPEKEDDRVLVRNLTRYCIHTGDARSMIARIGVGAMVRVRREVADALLARELVEEVTGDALAGVTPDRLDEGPTSD